MFIEFTSLLELPTLLCKRCGYFIHYANNNVSYSDQALNVSFTQGNYSVRENEEVLTVSVEGSGGNGSHVVVLIATHPSEGTATGEGILCVCIILS